MVFHSFFFHWHRAFRETFISFFPHRSQRRQIIVFAEQLSAKYSYFSNRRISLLQSAYSGTFSDEKTNYDLIVRFVHIDHSVVPFEREILFSLVGS